MTENSFNQEETPTIGFKIDEREYDSESAKTKIVHQDAFIEEQKGKMTELEAENETLRQKATEAKSLDDIIDRLDKKQVPSTDDDTSQATKEELLSELEERLHTKSQNEQAELAASERERIRKETFAETQVKLIEKFGNDGVDAAVIEAGLDMDTAMSMAADPKLAPVLLRQMKIVKPSPQGGPEKPASKYDVETQTQSNDDAKKLSKLSGRKRTEFYREMADRAAQEIQAG